MYILYRAYYEMARGADKLDDTKPALCEVGNEPIRCEHGAQRF